MLPIELIVYIGWLVDLPDFLSFGRALCLKYSTFTIWRNTEKQVEWCVDHNAFPNKFSDIQKACFTTMFGWRIETDSKLSYIYQQLRETPHLQSYDPRTGQPSVFRPVFGPPLRIKIQITFTYKEISMTVRIYTALFSEFGHAYFYHTLNYVDIPDLLFDCLAQVDYSFYEKSKHGEITVNPKLRSLFKLRYTNVPLFKKEMTREIDVIRDIHALTKSTPKNKRQRTQYTSDVV